ncbi:hypothetical protein ACEWY4_025275 [Coilia grayii]|uniref:Transmembrane protein 252 n=1 Tax=Coilia grayii TaxID=363190 RepID=A0ABD1IYV4_9TELE
MNKGKRLGIALRLVLLFCGFCLTCLGAYLKSLDGGSDATVTAIFSYILVACGFVLLLVGAFWSIFHGMRSNLYRQRRDRRHSTQVYICTVDRPNLYPPTYEESQARGHQVIPINPVCLGLAPPLYTLSSAEVVDEAFSHELPPSYHQALGQHCPNPGEPLEAQSQRPSGDDVAP